MFGGVYGELSEESTWQRHCRNLVLFYPNVGPGKGCNEVSWLRPISFPLKSHDFLESPLASSLHSKIRLYCWGHVAQEWGPLSTL